MKYRIISTILLLLILFGLYAMFSGNPEQTLDQGPIPNLQP